ncbi:MAG: phosphoribosylglycinamide formyltransferase [Steroidobacteraceae bacterium]
MTPAPLVILISGRGSNMRALIEASRAPQAGYRVVRVLSDKSDAGGLSIARELGVPAEALPAAGAADRSRYDASLRDAVLESAPCLVALAGFMRILGASFIEALEGRLMNIHPSLLPRYKGLHTHRRVLEAGDPEHGATVHYVSEELDGGPAVLQARVQVQPGDDEDRLSARVQAVEHRIFPLAVSWHCTGRLCWRKGQAILDGRRLEAPVTWNDSLKDSS